MTTPEALYQTARAYCDQNKLSVINGKLRVSQVMAFARDVHGFPIANEYYKVWDRIEMYMAIIARNAENKRIERIQQNFPQAKLF